MESKERGRLAASGAGGGGRARESALRLAAETVTLGRQGLVLRQFARQMRSYPTGFAAAGALLFGGLFFALRPRFQSRRSRADKAKESKPLRSLRR